MNKLIVALLSVAVIAFASAAAADSPKIVKGAKEESMVEAAIRQRIQHYSEAIGARNIEGVG